MSDLISRQAALDAIAKIDTNIIPSGWVKGYVNETIKETQRIIKTLPSAEPERQDFEWCHDCKEYDQEKHCCHRWTKVIRQTVEEVKAQTPKWIPVMVGKKDTDENA